MLIIQIMLFLACEEVFFAEKGIYAVCGPPVVIDEKEIRGP